MVHERVVLRVVLLVVPKRAYESAENGKWMGDEVADTSPDIRNQCVAQQERRDAQRRSDLLHLLLAPTLSYPLQISRVPK